MGGARSEAGGAKEGKEEAGQDARKETEGREDVGGGVSTGEAAGGGAEEERRTEAALRSINHQLGDNLTYHRVIRSSYL